MPRQNRLIPNLDAPPDRGWWVTSTSPIRNPFHAASTGM